MRTNERWGGFQGKREFGTKDMRRLRAGRGCSGLRQGGSWTPGDDYIVRGLVAEAFETEGEVMALISRYDDYLWYAEHGSAHSNEKQQVGTECVFVRYLM